MSGITEYWPYILIGLIALILLWPLFRIIIWRLFRFDREVADMLSSKKSSEVRLGKIAETLAPLLEDFPVEIDKPGTSTVFVGQPIDFIYFDPDQGVSFIEVKSGNSKLSGAQKKIKELILAGKVEWLEFRVR